MSNEKAKEIYNDLKSEFDTMVDSLSLEELLPHYRSEIKIYKKFLIHQPETALSAEKIAQLERAVDEFEKVYQAEKAEAEKMPFSWDEAERLRTLFDNVDEIEPPEVARGEH
jgi:CRISPR/Cas system CSM-associated protein Csm5 (group 7 of RAMP superfamily)